VLALKRAISVLIGSRLLPNLTAGGGKIPTKRKSLYKQKNSISKLWKAQSEQVGRKWTFIEDSVHNSDPVASKLRSKKAQWHRDGSPSATCYPERPRSGASDCSVLPAPTYVWSNRGAGEDGRNG